MAPKSKYKLKQQQQNPNSPGMIDPRNLPAHTRLGLQVDEESQREYEALRHINGFTFTTPPLMRYTSKQAEQRFTQMFGSMTPTFTPERFDKLRERAQVQQQRDRDNFMLATGQLYVGKLASNFKKSKDVDYAEFERMLHPQYTPTYDAAMKTIQIPKRKWWRVGKVPTLENICRLPLDRVTGESNETELSWEEWYSLFFNYYQPFNINAFYTYCVAQQNIWTKEFIENLADYLCERHAILEPEAQKAPILALGSRIGKLGGLLNATKKLPVPVVSAHEKPNTNPYLVGIPDELQNDFRPHPIQKLRMNQALEKYEPALVLYHDIPTGKDETYSIRMQGSVREYINIGIADSYVNGLGWETWGNAAHKPVEDRKNTAHVLPPFVQEGWMALRHNHLSRWLIHRNDSELCQGMGTCMSIMRKPLFPKDKQLFKYALKRFKPFY